jgi:hypothetical protein
MALPENAHTVTVPLDRPRRLALTLGAMRRIQQLTGQTVSTLADLSEADRTEHFHRLIWSLLVNEDREGLTPEDLEELIHAGNLQAIAEGFAAVLFEPLPTKGAEGNVVVVPPAAKAGKRRK